MTAIEWTHFPGYTGKSWNPVTGCEKIAQGCKNCYAEAVANRFWKGRKFTDVRTHADRLDQPLRARKPTCWFVNSMSDLFHEAVPFEFIAAVYGVMAACPQHKFIVLTKRPKRMREFFLYVDAQHRAACEFGGGCSDSELTPAHFLSARAHITLTDGFKHKTPWLDRIAAAPFALKLTWPLPNVIHGYSAANQADLDAGIADLLATPSALRCLSLEPLIGPIDLRQPFHDFGCPCGWGGDSPDAKCHECGWRGSDVVVEGLCPHCSQPIDDTDACPECGLDSRDGAGFGPNEGARPDWVIVGGESGKGARTCRAEWVRSVVAQCKAAEVPVFVKQLGARWYEEIGGYITAPLNAAKGGDPAEWPEDLRVRQFPEMGAARG